MTHRAGKASLISVNMRCKQWNEEYQKRLEQESKHAVRVEKQRKKRERKRRERFSDYKH